jgi:phosphoribosylformylglycinamidine synthase
VTENGVTVAEFPGTRLVTDCPVYHPEARESEEIQRLRATNVAAIAERPEESDPAWTLERLLAAPTIASKRWVYRQYDTMVRTNTVIGPGGDAAVVRLRGTDRALALKTDCNGRYVYLDPRVGGQAAVVEAARNVACAGGRPRAITNNLNFGSPKRPEVFYQFREAVAGMAEACRVLETPVTGGNVSFYNESPISSVYPTPVVGMVGLVESLAHVTRATFRRAGDAIVLLGENTDEIGASEYLATIHGAIAGAPPRVDLAGERRLVDALLDAIARGAAASAHDCSDGGLAVALAECCMADPDGRFGADVDLTAWSELPLRALLFGEAQGRVIVSTPDPEAVLAAARAHDVPARVIGLVAGPTAPLTIRVGDHVVAAPLDTLADAYHGAIPRIMDGTPEARAESARHGGSASQLE